MKTQSLLNDTLGILNRVDKSRTYSLVVANDSPVLYRLVDSERGYSPNLPEHEMTKYINGFAMGLEVMRDRMEAESEQKAELANVTERLTNAYYRYQDIHRTDFDTDAEYTTAMRDLQAELANLEKREETLKEIDRLTKRAAALWETYKNLEKTL